MADKKISQLPNSSALTGEELVPIVQAGVTAQTTLSNFGAAVGYLPAGTGAVATTVQAQLRSHDASLSVLNSITIVPTYAAMTSLGTPAKSTTYVVSADENKSYTNSIYIWLSTGARLWIASTAD